jgi:glucan endo-1,3-alpha-glucosidase
MYAPSSASLFTDIFRSTGHCGNSLTNNGASGNVISSYLCSIPCVGDLSQTCGGDWTLNVYTTSSKIPSNPHPSGQDVSERLLPSFFSAADEIKKEWKSLGCYVDSGDRLLKGYFLTQPGMTVAMCTSACSDQGYTFAAIEYGVECYCGNNLEPNGSGVNVDESQCNVACGGILPFLPGSSDVVR